MVNRMVFVELDRGSGANLDGERRRARTNAPRRFR